MVDSKGNATQRDLVQFVKFADFQNNGTALAKEVLEELPRQVSEYYQLMNMSPDDIARCYKRNTFLTQKMISCGWRKPPSRESWWRTSPSTHTTASDAFLYTSHSNKPYNIWNRWRLHLTQDHIVWTICTTVAVRAKKKSKTILFPNSGPVCLPLYSEYHFYKKDAMPVLA